MQNKNHRDIIDFWYQQSQTFLLLSLLIIFLSGCSWFPSATENPYQLIQTWGGHGSGQGQFNEPTGIAVTENEVFVSDSRNGRIQVFDHQGQYLRQFGLQETNSSKNVERPMNLTIAKQQLYVADYFSDNIKIFSLDGHFLGAIGEEGRDAGKFNAPGGAAVMTNGDIVVADFLNQRIQQLDQEGQFIRQWGNTGKVGIWSTEFNYPTDVAVDNNDNIYVADGYNDRVQVFSADGAYITRWGGPFGINIFGSFNGWFATVTGIAIDTQNNVFVADFYNDRIQKFTATGKFLNSFGVKSDSATHTAIAVDVANDGSVFVADYANHQIQKWRPSE